MVFWYAIKAIFGLRVSTEEEEEGLDIGEHGQVAYIFSSEPKAPVMERVPQTLRGTLKTQRAVKNVDMNWKLLIGSCILTAGLLFNIGAPSALGRAWDWAWARS